MHDIWDCYLILTHKRSNNITTTKLLVVVFVYMKNSDTHNMLITSCGTPVPCEMRAHARAKHVTIRLRPQGGVRVSYPARMDPRRARAFAREKSDWILRAIQTQKQKACLFPENIGTQEHYQAHKEEAKKMLSDMVIAWATRMNVSVSSVSIRNQRTRWGSCSSHGSIQLNYRLLFIPRDLAEYVVVHELCHRVHMNHSTAFWRLVETHIPDYKERKIKLRNLGIVG